MTGQERTLNQQLRDCYERLARLGLLGEAPEPLSVVEVVEEHRWHWRPARVKVLLLAESHVYTQETELVVMARAKAFKVPDRFVRLVYCLGYGETDFVGRDVSPTGTPQFWKVLFSCANPVSESTAFDSLLKTRNPSFERRIAAKVELLATLKSMGVWLVDASIVALYRGSRAGPDTKLRKKRIIQECWEHYVCAHLKRAEPSYTVIIGKGVADALGNSVAQVTNGAHSVVEQPQARLTSDRQWEIFNYYHQVCRRYCSGDSTQLSR